MIVKRSFTVDVQIACNDPGIPSDDEIRSWVELAVDSAGTELNGEIEVAVRVVDADEIRTLNGQYRQQDNLTNVLSFPAGDSHGLHGGDVLLLGDVVVCAAVVSAEAEAQGKKIADHWAHMLVHGALHLLGYDHEADSEAAAMERLETRILTGRGVADPYTGTPSK